MKAFEKAFSGVKLAVAGLIVLVAIRVIFAMYHANADPEIGRRAEVARAAGQNRPHDLQLLKRPAVRKACAEHADWDMGTCQTIDSREVSIGMTEEQVYLAWGKPEKINATISEKAHREQWVYGRQYLYVEDGVLRSMQTPR